MRRENSVLDIQQHYGGYCCFHLQGCRFLSSGGVCQNYNKVSVRMRSSGIWHCQWASTSQHYTALQRLAFRMSETTSLTKQHNTSEYLKLQHYGYKNWICQRIEWLVPENRHLNSQQSTCCVTVVYIAKKQSRQSWCNRRETKCCCLAYTSRHQRIYLCVIQSKSLLLRPCNIIVHFCGKHQHIHCVFGHT